MSSARTAVLWLPTLGAQYDYFRITTFIGDSRASVCSGIRISVRYFLHANVTLTRVEMLSVPAAYQGQIFTVSKREKNGATSPLLETRSEISKSLFELGSNVRGCHPQGLHLRFGIHLHLCITEQQKRMTTFHH